VNVAPAQVPPDTVDKVDTSSSRPRYRSPLSSPMDAAAAREPPPERHTPTLEADGMGGIGYMAASRRLGGSRAGSARRKASIWARVRSRQWPSRASYRTRSASIIRISPRAIALERSARARSRSASAGSGRTEGRSLIGRARQTLDRPQGTPHGAPYGWRSPFLAVHPVPLGLSLSPAPLSTPGVPRQSFLRARLPARRAPASGILARRRRPRQGGRKVSAE
jgi:hypothetical protein